MSIQLLDKTRMINNLLRKKSVSAVVFNDICDVLAKIMDSNVIVLSRKGKILGIMDNGELAGSGLLGTGKTGGHIDDDLNKRLLEILSTKENVNLETLGFSHEMSQGYNAMITPVEIAGERLGSLFVMRADGPYDIDDIILIEYGTTVVALEMRRSVSAEDAENERKIKIVRSAMNALSFSEQEAIRHIFEEMDGTEGVLIASKIADRYGITRSVIVNALRKLESAGILEARSSGMKGTHIKILNEAVLTVGSEDYGIQDDDE
ncbi:MAG: GTP-sensing pleiotropic transcriptional regulator CodY [Lachnospiraceae bacterium]|nr:GTP-sensing pleiotropic transcriptional regulator CodY [Lachnospiraceae bacterium]